mmetsp:Transcript_60887/g.175411  ORF Transcript_60887/g.175411 Transcript_60887/m.175411 type:complete len:253 (-) Transcript_60887:27-785(-)
MLPEVAGERRRRAAQGLPRALQRHRHTHGGLRHEHVVAHSQALKVRCGTSIPGRCSRLRQELRTSRLPMEQQQWRVRLRRRLSNGGGDYGMRREQLPGLLGQNPAAEHGNKVDAQLADQVSAHTVRRMATDIETQDAHTGEEQLHQKGHSAARRRHAPAHQAPKDEDGRRDHDGRDRKHWPPRCGDVDDVLRLGQHEEDEGQRDSGAASPDGQREVRDSRQGERGHGRGVSRQRRTATQSGTRDAHECIQEH